MMYLDEYPVLESSVIFMTKNKHMSLHDRIIINNGLNNGLSFKAIARTIGKNCSTVSKEVRKNSVHRDVSAPGRIFNNCLHRFSCQLYNICSTCHLSRPKICRSCKFCRSECDYFIEDVCPRLSKPPYVCNGCSDKNKCTLSKKLYFALEANKSYQTRLIDSRKGIVINTADIERLDNILVPLIKEQGQSIHHVYINHHDEIMMSEKTLYKIIDSGLLKVRNIDIPRKIRMRKRTSKPAAYKIEKKCLEGRRYEDFLKYLEIHPDTHIVQMDTVEGAKGENCLLTLHFTASSFMIVFKRDFNDSKSVTDIFNDIYDWLGANQFRKLFPVILTDNGSEFSNPAAIEFNDNGKRRTRIFYCHPSSSYEKGSYEVTHELLRRIVPKGKSWNTYTQKDINLMMSHINSYARAKLNDKSPFLLFSMLFGKEIATAFQITHIDADDINLSPSLLLKK